MSARLERGRGLAVALAVVTASALALRAGGVADQPLVVDDLVAGLTARNFVERGVPGPTMWNHPRLRDVLVAGSQAALGDDPWGLKLWSVLLGTAAVTATALLVRGAGGGAAAAVAAAAFVALDPLHVDFSRLAINDVYLSLFPVAAAWTLLRWRAGNAPAWLAACGALLGLGLASKWSAAFPVLAAAAIAVPPALRASPPRSRPAVACWAFAALAVLPAAVYVATWLPWFAAGHRLAELLPLHRAMAVETSTHVGYLGTKLPGFPGEVTSAWRWLVQPVWFVDAAAAPRPSSAPFVVGLTNPFVWLAVVPCGLWAARRALRCAGPERTLLVLFLAAYLPFVVVPRPIFANSAVAVLPFAAAVCGLAMGELWNRARALAVAWGSLVLAFGLLAWPAAAGRRVAGTELLVRTLVPAEAFRAPAGAAHDPPAGR